MNVRLAWLLWCAGWVSMITLPLLLTGCAEKRYLTKEQDEEVAKQCAEGCVIVPFPNKQERRERQEQRMAI